MFTEATAIQEIIILPLENSVQVKRRTVVSKDGQEISSKELYQLYASDNAEAVAILEAAGAKGVGDAAAAIASKTLAESHLALAISDKAAAVAAAVAPLNAQIAALEAQVLALTPPPTSPLSMVEQIVAAMTALFDSTAQAHRYDNRITCALRAGYVGPFQAEGMAFATWMDTCNSIGYQMLSKVQAGTREMPDTVDEALAMLPAMVWPA